MAEVPFHEMEVTNTIFQETDGLRQYGLQKEGEVYLVFLEGFRAGSLIPAIPVADYDLIWLNVDTGERRESTLQPGGGKEIESPFKEEQVVLHIRQID